jgi:hypothetical protein
MAGASRPRARLGVVRLGEVPFLRCGSYLACVRTTPPPFPRRRTEPARTAAAFAALALVVAAGCDDDDESTSATTVATSEISAPSETVAPAATAPSTGSTLAPGELGGVVSQEAAEQAALEHVGEGSVTWVTPEDDRGAAWEIEITRPDGSEVDVLIAPDGSVID